MTPAFNLQRSSAQLKRTGPAGQIIAQFATFPVIIAIGHHDGPVEAGEVTRLATPAPAKSVHGGRIAAIRSAHQITITVLDNLHT